MFVVFESVGASKHNVYITQTDKDIPAPCI